MDVYAHFVFAAAAVVNLTFIDVGARGQRADLVGALDKCGVTAATVFRYTLINIYTGMPITLVAKSACTLKTTLAVHAVGVDVAATVFRQTFIHIEA